MSSCLECICCCFFSSQPLQSTRRPTRSQSKPKIQKPKPKPSRLITKFKKEDIKKVSKQQKRSGELAYPCPICTLLFNKILACQQCENNICRDCFQSYQNKYLTSLDNMKCPFCFSQKSHFLDFQKQAHSYFDTTNNGFLSASQRKKIDKQIGIQSDTNSPLKTNSKMLNQKKIKLDDIKEDDNQNGNFNSFEGLVVDRQQNQIKQQKKQSIILQNQRQQGFNKNGEHQLSNNNGLHQYLVESKEEVHNIQENHFSAIEINNHQIQNQMH